MHGIKVLSRPLAIIGDVHGEVKQLSQLLTQTTGYRKIFVGDYVNRGGETRATLEQLIELINTDKETVCLLGNHDAGFLAFLEGTLPFYRFAAIGGIATIRSYLVQAHQNVRSELLEVFPYAHQEFLARCSDYFEAEDLLVSHCGINPANVASRDRNDMVMIRHDGLFAPTFNPPKVVVCGHYLQVSGLPYIREKFVCLDTGCGTTGGPLTALLLPERKFVQV
jgi:serine/threonine protein phosphatase 1